MSQPDYSNMRKLVTGDIVIKCRYGKDIRRLTINQAPTYDELCLMVSRIFKLPTSEDIILKYTDNENDLISLLDDNDISHAISLSTLLKITIFDKTSSELDPLVPGILPDELKLQLTTLRDSLDAILRYVPEKKADVQTQSGDVKYKPLSTAELASFLDASTTGPKPSVTPRQSTDALSNTTTNGDATANKQTPTMKNAMYFPPPGTPKQMPMKSPALQQMHPPPIPYGQRASPLNHPSYGPPPSQASPSAPSTPHSGGGTAVPAGAYQANNNVNKFAGPPPGGYMNARPPPPPSNMQQQQQPPRQQNGYPAPGTPLAQHQFPIQQMQRPPPPQMQPGQAPPPQQQQQQQPPSSAGSVQGPPHAQNAPNMPPAGFNPPAATQQQVPQQQQQQQPQNYYQPSNAPQQQQQQQQPYSQNFRPPPNPSN